MYQSINLKENQILTACGNLSYTARRAAGYGLKGSKRKTVVYWKTNKERRLEICKDLGLEFIMNVNRESTYNLNEEVREKLRELENEGLIVVRVK